VKNDDLEASMRELEWFHDLRVLPATWPVIRVDGRGFTRLAENRKFERPFDVRFHEMMVKTAEALVAELHGAFAFTESDEISVLLPADTQLFNREVEKLVSVSAGIASSTFALQLGNAACSETRVKPSTRRRLRSRVRVFQRRTSSCSRAASTSTICRSGKGAASACIGRVLRKRAWIH